MKAVSRFPTDIRWKSGICRKENGVSGNDLRNAVFIILASRSARMKGTLAQPDLLYMETLYLRMTVQLIGNTLGVMCRITAMGKGILTLKSKAGKVGRSYEKSL